MFYFSFEKNIFCSGNSDVQVNLLGGGRLTCAREAHTIFYQPPP